MTAPAYIIVEMNVSTMAKAPACVKAFAVHMRGGRHETMEGDWQPHGRAEVSELRAGEGLLRCGPYREVASCARAPPSTSTWCSSKASRPPSERINNLQLERAKMMQSLTSSAARFWTRAEHPVRRAAESGTMGTRRRSSFRAPPPGLARSHRAARRRQEPLRRQGRAEGRRAHQHGKYSESVLGLDASEQAFQDADRPGRHRQQGPPGAPNATLAVSMAVARAAAEESGLPHAIRCMVACSCRCP